jgi:hypothetical protein
MPNIISKLLKIDTLTDLGNKVHIKNGDVLSGYFTKWPTVGRSFQFIESTKVVHTWNGNIESIINMPIQTSCVIENIDDRTFKTENSVYKIITIDDERENRIKIILE